MRFDSGLDGIISCFGQRPKQISHRIVEQHTHRRILYTYSQAWSERKQCKRIWNRWNTTTSTTNLNLDIIQCDRSTQTPPRPPYHSSILFIYSKCVCSAILQEEEKEKKLDIRCAHSHQEFSMQPNNKCWRRKHRQQVSVTRVAVRATNAFTFHFSLHFSPFLSENLYARSHRCFETSNPKLQTHKQIFTHRNLGGKHKWNFIYSQFIVRHW